MLVGCQSNWTTPLSLASNAGLNRAGGVTIDGCTGLAAGGVELPTAAPAEEPLVGGIDADGLAAASTATASSRTGAAGVGEPAAGAWMEA